MEAALLSDVAALAALVAAAEAEPTAAFSLANASAAETVASLAFSTAMDA